MLNVSALVKRIEALEADAARRREAERQAPRIRVISASELTSAELRDLLSAPTPDVHPAEILVLGIRPVDLARAAE